MRLKYLKSFARDYAGLPENIKDQVDKQIRFLLADARHPSLHVKKMPGRENVWECRVSKGCRLTFQIDEETFILRRVGAHDVLERP